jgi:hypothetical protein
MLSMRLLYAGLFILVGILAEVVLVDQVQTKITSQAQGNLQAITIVALIVSA